MSSRFFIYKVFFTIVVITLLSNTLSNAIKINNFLSRSRMMTKAIKAVKVMDSITEVTFMETTGGKDWCTEVAKTISETAPEEKLHDAIKKLFDEAILLKDTNQDEYPEAAIVFENYLRSITHVVCDAPNANIQEGMLKRTGDGTNGEGWSLRINEEWATLNLFQRLYKLLDGFKNTHYETVISWFNRITFIGGDKDTQAVFLAFVQQVKIAKRTKPDDSNVNQLYNLLFGKDQIKVKIEASTSTTVTEYSYKYDTSSKMFTITHPKIKKINDWPKEVAAMTTAFGVQRGECINDAMGPAKFYANLKPIGRTPILTQEQCENFVTLAHRKPVSTQAYFVTEAKTIEEMYIKPLAKLASPLVYLNCDSHGKMFEVKFTANPDKSYFTEWHKGVKFETEQLKSAYTKGTDCVVGFYVQSPPLALNRIRDITTYNALTAVLINKHATVSDPDFSQETKGCPKK